ncbi:hypothetical protein EAI30_20215, partial [Romboutsia ilealis]|nr:hypothetical protein [Romboutsia ilealis]
DEQDFFGVNKNKINVMQEEAEKVSPQEEIPAVEKPEDLPTQEKESKLDNSPADKQEPEEIGGTFHPDGKEKALPEGSNDIKLDDMKKKVVH